MRQGTAFRIDGAYSLVSVLVKGAQALALGLLVALLATFSVAHAITTEAKQAIVVDAETGTVLYEKNARQQMAPSSMTKVMTAYVVFNALRAGQLRSIPSLWSARRRAAVVAQLCGWNRASGSASKNCLSG